MVLRQLAGASAVVHQAQAGKYLAKAKCTVRRESPTAGRWRIGAMDSIELVRCCISGCESIPIAHAGNPRSGACEALWI